MGSRRARGFDCDAYNERQIALRKQRPIEEVLRELRDGLSADVDRVEQLDEAFLLQTLPDFRGQVLPVSDQMRAYIGRHPRADSRGKGGARAMTDRRSEPTASSEAAQHEAIILWWMPLLALLAPLVFAAWKGASADDDALREAVPAFL